MYVIGKCVKFSHVIIDAYLGKNKSSESEKVLFMYKIEKDIIVGQVKQLRNNGLLSYGKLRVKYVFLNRICAANYAPVNHSSSITHTLAKLIYQTGTKLK